MTLPPKLCPCLMFSTSSIYISIKLTVNHIRFKCDIHVKVLKGSIIYSFKKSCFYIAIRLALDWWALVWRIYLISVVRHLIITIITFTKGKNIRMANKWLLLVSWIDTLERLLHVQYIETSTKLMLCNGQRVTKISERVGHCYVIFWKERIKFHGYNFLWYYPKRKYWECILPS